MKRENEENRKKNIQAERECEKRMKRKGRRTYSLRDRVRDTINKNIPPETQ